MSSFLSPRIIYFCLLPTISPPQNQQMALLKFKATESSWLIETGCIEDLVLNFIQLKEHFNAGKTEIWVALRAAVDATFKDDVALAQAILDGAGVSLPGGSMTECYDEWGTR